MGDREHMSGKTIAVCSAALGMLGAFVLQSAIPNIFTLPVRMDNLEERMSDIESSVRNIEDSVGKIDKSLAKMGIETGIAMTDVVTEPGVAVKMNNALNGRDRPVQAAPVKFSPETVIGHRKGSGEKVLAESISNCKILLPYMNGDQEVFFYGQINENGYWDGDCTLNTYENDQLVLITDAVYENGELIRCKQVFSYPLRSGQPVWAYSDRSRQDGYSSGETWLYVKDSERTKDFTIDDVDISDILSADGFKEQYGTQLVAYYSGNTSDGYFNDTTGEAYMVYFFENGYVRQLYCGNFENGTYNDATGNAWYILREDDTDYMYVKGAFRNGKEVHNKPQETLPPPLTMEAINKILAGRVFKVELKWADRNGPLDR